MSVSASFSVWLSEIASSFIHCKRSGEISPNYSDVQTENVFVVMKIHVMVFWVVTSCSVVVGYQSLGDPCCLHIY